MDRWTSSAAAKLREDDSIVDQGMQGCKCLSVLSVKPYHLQVVTLALP